MMRINPRNDRDTYSLLRGSKKVSQRVQKRPKGHQNDPKGWPKRCQETSKIVKEPLRAPKASKEPPKGTKGVQRASKGSQMEPKKEPKRDPKRVPKGGPGEDPEKGDLISSISMPVSNGMLTFGTCLSMGTGSAFSSQQNS